MEYMIVGYQLPAAQVLKAVAPMKKRKEEDMPSDEQRDVLQRYFRTLRLGKLTCLVQDGVVTIGYGMHVPVGMSQDDKEALLEKKDFAVLKNTPLFKLLKKDDESVVKTEKTPGNKDRSVLTKETDVKEKKKRKKDKEDEEKMDKGDEKKGGKDEPK